MGRPDWVPLLGVVVLIGTAILLLALLSLLPSHPVPATVPTPRPAVVTVVVCDPAILGPCPRPTAIDDR